MITSAHIELFGYVGKDPAAPSSNNPNFVTFSLSVTNKRKDKNTNEEIKTTTWYECQTGIEAVAKYIKQYIKKGTPLYLEGIPRCDAYLDKEGKAVASFKVNIKGFPNILSAPENKDDTKLTAKAAVFHNDLNDDEIPF